MYFVARVQRYGNELRIEVKREYPGKEDIWTEDMSNIYVKRYDTAEDAQSEVKEMNECVIKV